MVVVVDWGGAKRSKCKAVSFSISNFHVIILLLGRGGFHCIAGVGYWGEGSSLRPVLLTSLDRRSVWVPKWGLLSSRPTMPPDPPLCLAIQI